MLTGRAPRVSLAAGLALVAACSAPRDASHSDPPWVSATFDGLTLQHPATWTTRRGRGGLVVDAPPGEPGSPRIELTTLAPLATGGAAGPALRDSLTSAGMRVSSQVARRHAGESAIVTTYEGRARLPASQVSAAGQGEERRWVEACFPRPEAWVCVSCSAAISAADRACSLAARVFDNVRGTPQTRHAATSEEPPFVRPGRCNATFHLDAVVSVKCTADCSPVCDAAAYARAIEDERGCKDLCRMTGDAQEACEGVWVPPTAPQPFTCWRNGVAGCPPERPYSGCVFAIPGNACRCRPKSR